jgi:hypothetical protein
VIGISSKHDRWTINLGQQPFAFNELNPPEGWVLYDPKTTDLWQRVPPVFGHIEGYYRDLGTTTSHAEMMISAQPLEENGRVELTITNMTSSKSISIGVGQPGSRSVSVQSPDGIFIDGEHPPVQIAPPDMFKGEEPTIGFARKGAAFEFTLDGNSYDVPACDGISSFLPFVMWKDAGFSFVVNNGQFPFVATGSSGDIELLNRTRVTMSEDGLEQFGLVKDDVVESRDRLFFGKVIGIFRGRPYFQVPGLSGAVCLNSPDPLYHRMLLRIVSRPRWEYLWVPALVLEGVHRVNVGSRSLHPPMSVICGDFGAALLLGTDSEGRCVVRPLSDTISCANAILLRSSARKTLLTEKFQGVTVAWFMKHARVWPLDVTVASESALCIVVGFRGNTAVAFDGTKVVEVPPNSRPLFRFVGYDSGVKLGQYLLYSVCAASFVNGSVVNFSNEICGVYGIHIVQSQRESLSNHPRCFASPLPPYVDRMLKSLSEERGPTMMKITMQHVQTEDIFYECEIPPDAQTIAEVRSKPGILTRLALDGCDGPNRTSQRVKKS